MNLKTEKKEQEIGKKSQAVRTKLIERTSQCEEVSLRAKCCISSGSSSNR